eukprot:CAMPEP_0178698966 /NCGR_PEP_ID=MMETSP0699-20121125/10817_1 /TAXON_ID=265572 /ORGANISM="Extubocellulus spinifer, Strain CCMP396" /LENGTH=527 /DNA_ID=CAMNT_0020345059 /DNA_START=2279 /DNA_END=3859 /DNA_ORIENTATION=+
MSLGLKKILAILSSINTTITRPSITRRQFSPRFLSVYCAGIMFWRHCSIWICSVVFLVPCYSVNAFPTLHSTSVLQRHHHTYPTSAKPLRSRLGEGGDCDSSVISRSAQAPSGGAEDGNTSTNGDEKSSKTSGSNNQQRTRRRRNAAYPESAYHLAKDEANLRHSFISFIDHSIGSRYTQVERMVEPRTYARPDQFTKEYRDVPPTIADVAPPPSLYGPTAKFLAWNDLPARLIVGGMSYFAFPYIVESVTTALGDSINHEALAELVGNFMPSVSIILGTYFSLTLGILYERKRRIQETVALEAAALSRTSLNLLDLFADDAEAAVQAAQCIVDQINILVRDSRGREVMGVIYSDPYARINHLLHTSKEKVPKGEELDPCLLAEVRKGIENLYTMRTQRMSDEAMGLPPTHFDVMTFLCGLLLTGFVLGTVASEQYVCTVSRVSFSALVASYVIFYEMMFDLNRPFDGVYQVRRCTAAMYMLQIKQVISNHPLVKGQVLFESVESDEDDDPPADCDAECERQKRKMW